MKNIVFEDEHILVAYKPAGIATQTKRVGQQDMVSEIKNYLNKTSAGKGGKKEPYVGLIHRLDQPVCGLLVFGKTPEAASFLSEEVREGTLEKYYYAIVYGRPEKENGELKDYLYKDPKSNMSLIVKEGFPDSKEARLEYQCIKTLFALEDNVEASLLEIKLITGRHHQIRAQLSNAGMPILGDTKYGSIESKEFSRESSCRNIALCAHRLSFIHPVTKKELTFLRNSEDDIFKAFL